MTRIDPRPWTATIALALTASIALSGCYALDPEMRRIVAERHARERAAKAATQNPAATGDVAAVDVRRERAPSPTPPAPDMSAPPADAAAAEWLRPAERPDAADAATASDTLAEVAAAYLILTLEAGTH